jgi:hypothetical protein
MRILNLVIATAGLTLGAVSAQAAGTCATADGHAVEKATTKEQCDEAKGVWTEAKAAADTKDAAKEETKPAAAPAQGTTKPKK